MKIVNKITKLIKGNKKNIMILLGVIGAVVLLNALFGTEHFVSGTTGEKNTVIPSLSKIHIMGWNNKYLTFNDTQSYGFTSDKQSDNTRFTLVDAGSGAYGIYGEQDGMYFAVTDVPSFSSGEPKTDDPLAAASIPGGTKFTIYNGDDDRFCLKTWQAGGKTWFGSSWAGKAKIATYDSAPTKETYPDDEDVQKFQFYLLADGESKPGSESTESTTESTESTESTEEETEELEDSSSSSKSSDDTPKGEKMAYLAGGAVLFMVLFAYFIYSVVFPSGSV